PGVVIPFAQLLTYRLLFTLHPGCQQATDGTQGTRARQYHPEAPQGQHGGLGLAQMGQMLHDSRPPLVETSLAKHGFPPCGCGLLHIPQYAVGREVISPEFQKTSPCKEEAPPPKRRRAWQAQNFRGSPPPAPRPRRDATSAKRLPRFQHRSRGYHPSLEEAPERNE